jgi:hypothetical protein
MGNKDQILKDYLVDKIFLVDLEVWTYQNQTFEVSLNTLNRNYVWVEYTPYSNMVNKMTNSNLESFLEETSKLLAKENIKQIYTIDSNSIFKLGLDNSLYEETSEDNVIITPTQSMHLDYFSKVCEVIDIADLMYK